MKRKYGNILYKITGEKINVKQINVQYRTFLVLLFFTHKIQLFNQAEAETI